MSSVLFYVTPGSGLEKASSARKALGTMSSKLSSLFSTAMRTVAGTPFQMADVAGNVLLVTNVASY